MTKQTPRESLAAAVKALDAHRAAWEAHKEASTQMKTSDVEWKKRGQVLLSDVIISEVIVEDYARALLEAPDDAAELRAVKALTERAAALSDADQDAWVLWDDEVKCWVFTLHPTKQGQLLGTIDGKRHSSPTAVELAAKLGIEVSRE